ncbi:hypothetical protein BKA65DRAFT_479120 [Rhexocercosporidium sp. MPI-PUGE-AT-0058]|nr:hypothetical protein BKA65DRAFT_479120 [Rhexocercosporidium sp. MPI-PUGE-AT-0058]
MHLFLVLIAASSASAGNYRQMNLNPAHHTMWPRASDMALPPTSPRPAMSPVLPDYKAEIFMCGMGPEMKGYCCETLTKDGVGMGCKNATPIIANFMDQTVTFDCPMIIKDVKQKHTAGACCSPNATMITPSMALYKCQGSPIVSVDIESKKPNVIGAFSDQIPS